MDLFIGTWRMLKYEAIQDTPNGFISKEINIGPGLLIYSSDGYMSVQIQRKDSENINPQCSDMDKYVHDFAGWVFCTTYCGKYSVFEKKKRLEHYVKNKFLISIIK